MFKTDDQPKKVNPLSISCLAFAAGAATSAGLHTLIGKETEQQKHSSSAVGPALVRQVEPAPDCALEFVLPPSERVAVNSTPTGAEQSPSELNLAELRCDDPQFKEEFLRRTADYQLWLEKALYDCNFPVEAVTPAILRESIQISVGDQIREALQSEDSALIASTLADQLSEIRFQLQLALRDKLDIAGVGPVQEQMTLPAHFNPDASQQLGIFSATDSTGKQSLFLFDTVNGQHIIRAVPADWPEANTIIALQFAEEAAWNIDQ